MNNSLEQVNSITAAVIDVGTNSVKLLVGEICDGVVSPIYETSYQTRLGSSLYSYGKLMPDSIASTCEAINQLVYKARKLSSQFIRIFATSAARDASNSSELQQLVKTETGLDLEIISEEQEAIWAFDGITQNLKPRIPVIVLDVGGGSTQLSVGLAGTRPIFQSLDLGAVRLMHSFPRMHQDEPPGLATMNECIGIVSSILDTSIDLNIKAWINRFRSQSVLFGAGGTASVLASVKNGLKKFDRQLIDSTIISTPELLAMLEQLWTKSLKDRELIVGLPKNKADIIIFGVVIYFSFIKLFQFAELRPSTRGIRFGALLDSVRAFYKNKPINF
jgi:exopolyphosphatase/guanosine-5'-triphosphate,3'-diphosphate pyrophosphatase